MSGYGWLGALTVVGILACVRPAQAPLSEFSSGAFGSEDRVREQLIQGRWRVHLRVTDSDSAQDRVAVGIIDAERHSHTVDFRALGLEYLEANALGFRGALDTLFFELGPRHTSHSGVAMWLAPLSTDSAAGEWVLAGWIGARGTVHARRIQ